MAGDKHREESRFERLLLQAGTSIFLRSSDQANRGKTAERYPMKKNFGIEIMTALLIISPVPAMAAEIQPGTFVRVQSDGGVSDGVEVSLYACESFDTCVEVKHVPDGKSSTVKVGCVFFKGNIAGKTGKGTLSSCRVGSIDGTFEVVDENGFNISNEKSWRANAEIRMYRRK